MLTDEPHALNPLMTNHVVVRNRSLWICKLCPQSWPYPSPLPQEQTCLPRRWSDGAA